MALKKPQVAKKWMIHEQNSLPLSAGTGSAKKSELIRFT